MDERTTQPSLRDVMAGFPTGVTVVAARDPEGEPYGLTVNSFTSVSLDPPLVLVCIARSATSHDRLGVADRFTVNILAADQAEVARRFAREPSEGRFDEVAWSNSPGGGVILYEAVGWLDCVVERVVGAGDHSIVVGRVAATDSTDRPALLFHRGCLRSAEG